MSTPEVPAEYADDNDALCARFVNRNLPKVLHPRSKRPWVTLTWAQSLDGRVASHPGQPRLMISGQESMQMTFRLRSRHEAILVSRATLTADNSQLSVRNMPESQIVDQPIPVILDSTLQSPPEARLFQASRSPVLVYKTREDDAGLAERARVLQSLGTNLMPVDPKDYHLERIFELLKLKFSINSVLVEPGLTLIPAMLSLPNLIDLVVITTGSKVIGSAGRTPHWSESTTVGLSNLQHVDTTLVGHDVVTVLTSTNSTRGAEK